MKLIEYGPGLWQLYQQGDSLFLSVRCQASFAEFETLILLSPEEVREFEGLGRVFLEYLAGKVSYYWPSEYRGRDVSKEWGAAVTEVVREWLSLHPGEHL